MTESYSQVAWEQFDLLEASDPGAYSDTLDLIEAIMDAPGEARGTADVVATSNGPRFKNVVQDRYPLAVFWSDHAAEGPRIEAVFGHPANRS